MLLYDSPVSGNCYKVRLLLAHLAIPYERRTVDVVDRSNRRELLGNLNPSLRVPTLVLDDGRALGESGAILWYFGEGTRFVPDDRYERAQVLQWLFFEQYDHEPAVAVARFWLAISGNPDAYERAQVLQWLFFEQYDLEPALAVIRFWLAYSGRADEFREQGYLAEFGPNTILETSPKIRALVENLGLVERRLYSDPGAEKRFIVRGGKPVQLPGSPAAFMRTPLFSSRATRNFPPRWSLAPPGEQRC